MSKTGYFIGGLILGFAVMWACTQAPQPEAAVKTQTKPGFTKHEITKGKADSLKNSWESVIPALKGRVGADSVYVVQGFHVPHNELVEILSKAPIDSTRKVWAMLGIEKGLPCLVFQVSDARKSGTSNAATNYTYFNFTYPCPPNCPDK